MAIASSHGPNQSLQPPKKRKMPCYSSRIVLAPPSKRRCTSTAPVSELLPGLPDDLAIVCLAKVPSLALLWRVCASWQAVVSHSAFFHSVRSSLGFSQQQWIYALIHNPSAEGVPRSSVSSQSDACDITATRAPFSWHAYDPIAKSWHSLPALPHPVDFHLSSPSVLGLVHSVQCVSSTSKLFMVAGSRADNVGGNGLEPALDCPLIFDTQTQEWAQGAPFGVPRKWCVCGIAADKLLVASGCGRQWDMELAKTSHLYDPESGDWVEVQRLRSCTFSRMGLTAVTYKGKLHVVSGVGAIFDPATGEWGDMPRGMKDGWSGQGVVVGEKLFVLEECSGRLKVYEPAKDEWRIVAMEDDVLKHMEQIAGSMAGMFCGIVRSQSSCRTGAGAAAAALQSEGDVIRIIDLRGEKPRALDVHPPFGRVVTLQVLARTF